MLVPSSSTIPFRIQRRQRKLFTTTAHNTADSTATLSTVPTPSLLQPPPGSRAAHPPCQRSRGRPAALTSPQPELTRPSTFVPPATLARTTATRRAVTACCGSGAGGKLPPRVPAVCPGARARPPQRLDPRRRPAAAPARRFRNSTALRKGRYKMPPDGARSSPTPHTAGFRERGRRYPPRSKCAPCRGWESRGRMVRLTRPARNWVALRSSRERQAGKKQLQ
jgi:hypothetical protein